MVPESDRVPRNIISVLGEKDMASADSKNLSLSLSSTDARTMETYGITRVPVDYFYFGGFRYTNLKDAVAEAKRQQKAK